MSAIFDINNPLMRLLSRIFDLMLLGILWIVGYLPVITVGAATTALYTVLLKLVSGDDYTVWPLYWKAFKANFKQATLVWVLFLAVSAVLIADVFVA